MFGGGFTAKRIDYKGMFTLRPDGRYQGYWKDGDGKRHTICDRDAEKLYHRIIERENPPKVTFGEIADAWQEKHWERITNGTKTCYGPAVRRAVERFGDVPADSLTPNDIYTHLSALNSQRYSQKTIATQKTVYRLIYENAIIDDRFSRDVKVNPVNNVPMPSGIKPKEVREAPEADVIEIIKGGVNKPFGLFPYFLLHTGFRIEEAAAITWGDIDFKAKTVTCNKAVDFHASKPCLKVTKTSAGVRTVPLLSPLEAVLKEHLDEDSKPTALVFPNSNGGYYTRSALRSRWLCWCKEVGLVTTEEVIRTHSVKKCKYKSVVFHPSVTPHQLRHAYCTILYEVGVDELTAMQLMGHSDYETTRKIYTHLRQKHLGEITYKLEKAFE